MIGLEVMIVTLPLTNESAREMLQACGGNCGCWAQVLYKYAGLKSTCFDIQLIVSVPVDFSFQPYGFQVCSLLIRE